jgi:peptidoglycan/LPS O-acetylase OafA/YrhL
MSISSIHAQPADSVSRVLGWDVLRGLSALAVAVYHLFLWQDLASLHSFGSYGVYLFFVLSGASLAYTYAERFEQGRFSLPQFLWVRYMRLAPLYLTLMLVILPWKLAKDGMTGTLLAKLALNASFLFGLYNPADSSVLVGGWSLGIEAIFYLLFPLMLAAASHRAALAGFALLALIQAAWIWRVFELPGGYAAHAVFYHQVPAFAAYFMGGCLIGVGRRSPSPIRLPTPVVLAGIAGGFLLLLLLNPQRQGDELFGWQGAVLSTLCFVLVWLAGRLDLRRRPGAQSIAAHLGDSTYGMYLMHPVVFFGISFVLLPKAGLLAPDQWTSGARLLLALAVVLVAFTLAILSERYFERPLREWSKMRSKRHIDAASISS